MKQLRYWRPEYKSDETKPKKGINSTGRQTTDINSSRGDVHITCNGITCFDTDHMGNISYYPGPFFKDYFFPFDGSRWYRSPLIGIQFENLNRKS